MPRQSDSRYRLTKAARDFDIDHRERDRDSGAAIQNIVEAAIAGIVVIDFVAAEAEIPEKVVVRTRPQTRGHRRKGKLGLRFRTQCVQNHQKGPWIQIGRLDGSNFECRHVEPAFRRS